jgi:triphosphatase
MQQDRPPAPEREIEWQFDVLDVRPVERWLSEQAENGEPEIAPGGLREISDTYYDTGDWRLYRAGFALRVRRRKGSGSAEATLKSLESATEGRRTRREISERIESEEALRDAPGGVGERIRALIGSEALDPIFEVRTRRRTFALSGADGAVGEVVLDETEIPMPGDAGRPAVLRRVEVELVAGGEDHLEELERFVDSLRAGCQLSPAATSKYEAALFARGLEPPEPPDFGSKEVDASRTIGEVAYAVMREQFEAFLRHEPGTRLGEDPEELHDMRVASRRARSAMQIFAGALPVRSRRFRDELKWIAGELGEVRDLDVQLEQLAGWISEAAEEDREPLRNLTAVIEERRAKARRNMLRTLDSRRYARFVEAYGAFLRRGPSSRSLAARQPVTEAAPVLLRDIYRKARKAGDKIEAGSPAEHYHKLRIRFKRLRYAAEFLRGIYGGPAESFIKALKRLQDVLGDHQDAEVAITHLRELATARSRGRKLPPETVFVMGGLAHRYRVEAAGLRGEFPGAYARMTGKRWKRFKKAMEV